MYRAVFLALTFMLSCEVEPRQPEPVIWKKLADAMNSATVPEKASWVVTQESCSINLRREYVGRCDRGDVKLSQEINIDQTELKEIITKSHDGITMISFYFNDAVTQALQKASSAQSARGDYSDLVRTPMAERNNLARQILDQAGVNSFGFVDTCYMSDLVYLDWVRVNLLADKKLYSVINQGIHESMEYCLSARAEK